MSVAEYGDLTPRELMLIVDEYNYLRQQQRENMITQAYMTAAWSRTTRMPKLDEVLKGIRPKWPPATQTPEQMLAFAKQMQAAFDGKGGGMSHGRRT